MNRCRLVALLALVFTLGCGAAAPQMPTIQTLRERAAQMPKDFAAQRRLALAELFSAHGEPSQASAPLTKAIALDANDPWVRLAAGVYEDVKGEPAAAYAHYVAALTAAVQSQDETAPHVAELSVHALANLAGAVPEHAQRTEQMVAQALRSANLPLPPRFEIASLLSDLATRRGDIETVKQLAREVGCVDGWRAAGPFGPHALLGFDTKHIDPAQPLGEAYALGPGRGTRAVRTLGMHGCELHFGGGPLGLGGTSYAQTRVRIDQPGRYTLRVESPNSVEVFVDGVSQLRIDRRGELAPRVVYTPIDLAVGTYLLTLKVSSRHPSPVASLALTSGHRRDVQAAALPFSPAPRDGFGAYLRAGTAMLRGDLDAARATLAGVDRARHVSPLLRMQRASLLLADPLLPDDVRQDEARRLLRLANRSEPTLWFAPVQLARMLADQGRPLEAIAALRRAAEQWPHVPAIGMALSDLYRDKGWDVQADRELRRVRQLVPDACGPLLADIDALRRRDREREAAELVEDVMKCQADANARYSMLLQRRDWDAAAKELARLRALDTTGNEYGWLLAEAELAKSRGDGATLDRVLASLAQLFPRSESATTEQLDRLLAHGARDEALRLLQARLQAEPASLARLQRLVPIAGGKHVLARWRRDGAEALKAFEASGRSYDGPQALIFDYMAGQVFEDGSSLELVHTIYKVQSDEAVDDLAEARVPEGAQVLTLHVIKPDGRRLEPDAIAGKDTISLPSVEVGDYVETEYVLAKEAPSGLPGAYVGERFYFKSFEIPFDHSEMVMVLPAAMPHVVDPRGAAPELSERVEGDERILQWSVDQSRPLRVEPGSVSAREYIPSVRVGANASWPAFVDGLREALADRDTGDPEHARLVAKIVRGLAPNAYRERAQRLYAWVLDNIENTNDMFAQAAVMLRSRTGNRARVLHYLLGLAGVPSQLALASAVYADQTPSQLADGERYDHLMVRIGPDEQPTWLYTVERWAPFGFVPAPLRGQEALLLAAGAPRVHVRAAHPAEDDRTLAITLKLERTGRAEFEVLETVRGHGAIAWRSRLESVPQAELDRRFEQEYLARLVPGARLTSLAIADAQSRKPSIELRYNFEVLRLGHRVSNGWALPALLTTELSKSYAQVNERTTDQLVSAPLDLGVSLRIELPTGTRKPPLPQPSRIVAAAGERPVFELSHQAKGNVVQIERRIHMPVMRVRSREYPAFATFCRQVDAAEGRQLVFGFSD